MNILQKTLNIGKLYTVGIMSINSGSLSQNKASFGLDLSLKFHLQGECVNFSGNKTQQSWCQLTQQLARSPKLLRSVKKNTGAGQKMVEKLVAHSPHTQPFRHISHRLDAGPKASPF